VFQLRDGALASLLRIPAHAPPLAPIAGNQTRIAGDGAHVTIVVGAPVLKQQAGVGGSAAIAMPLDLAPLKRRLAEHVQSATLRGFGPAIALVDAGGAGTPVAVKVPLGAELGAGEVSLTAVFAGSPGAIHDKIRIARWSCWALCGGLFVLYVAGLLRGRKRS
jgi:hypothetical protein